MILQRLDHNGPRNNKNILLLSTMHEDAAVAQARQKSLSESKGEVDCLDKITIKSAFTVLLSFGVKSTTIDYDMS